MNKLLSTAMLDRADNRAASRDQADDLVGYIIAAIDNLPEGMQYHILTMLNEDIRAAISFLDKARNEKKP